MKTKITFRGKDFEADQDVNKDIYARLTSDADEQNQDHTIKVYLNNRYKYFSNELIDFLNSTGIDWTKENETFHCEIDEKQTIIEGWFDIVGKVLSNEKVTSFYWGDESYTTNIHFTNNSKHGMRPEFKDNETFRFDFAILLQKEMWFEKTTNS